MDRYARQIDFKGIGAEGQSRLATARVCIIGVGALGGAAAELLCRAGVGFIRLIDHDCVALTNLHRQLLYSEDDVATSKVTTAATRLARINSTVVLEPLDCTVDATTVDACIAGVDLVLDGTDNLATRTVINKACHRARIPWIYAGITGSQGVVMNILWDDGPCFQCFMGGFPTSEKRSTPSTTNPAGILNTIPTVIAALECSEAIKILVGSPTVSRTYTMIDVWHNTVDYITQERDPLCPVCGKPNTDPICSKPNADLE